MNYTIRELNPSELELVKEFTYEAIFQRDEHNPIGREVLEEPEIKVFYENFGGKTDLCLVAEVEGHVVGAVWTRILSGEIKGFGNINPETPEFGIALYKGYRGQGIGTDLMIQMLTRLKEKGYTKTSLAVQKDNYALKLYLKVGFSIIKELEEEYLMVCDLTQG